MFAKYSSSRERSRGDLAGEHLILSESRQDGQHRGESQPEHEDAEPALAELPGEDDEERNRDQLRADVRRSAVDGVRQDAAGAHVGHVGFAHGVG